MKLIPIGFFFEEWENQFLSFGSKVGPPLGKSEFGLVFFKPSFDFGYGSGFCQLDFGSLGFIHAGGKEEIHDHEKG
jgi:hypothetical protein